MPIDNSFDHSQANVASLVWFIAMSSLQWLEELIDIAHIKTNAIIANKKKTCISS
jgi:hypothetical protein